MYFKRFVHLYILFISILSFHLTRWIKPTTSAEMERLRALYLKHFGNCFYIYIDGNDQYAPDDEYRGRVSLQNIISGLKYPKSLFTNKQKISLFSIWPVTAHQFRNRNNKLHTIGIKSEHKQTNEKKTKLLTRPSSSGCMKCCRKIWRMC